VEKSDEELMLRFGQGDDLAFNELVERWQQPLVRYIYRYVGSRATALDLAQETFVRIFQQRHRFKEKLRFSAWLFTIALNLCRSSHRWQSRHQTVALEEKQEQESWETESGLLTSSSPADDALRKELAIVVRSAVQTLPDKLKAVVLLADYEDLSHHEIAQILGCSAKAVETRLYRAHRILRGKLRDLFV
jgi:RNA polymerase sigma-70 factor (ECF subfamily)